MPIGIRAFCCTLITMSVRSLFGGIVGESATPPIPFTPRWASRLGSLGAMFGHRDRAEDLKAMSATPTLYGVIRKLAQMTALVEWDLCLKPTVAGDEPVPLEGAVAERAAPLMVWNRPHRFLYRAGLVAACQQHKDLAGEFWWVIEKVGRVPVAIWPVRPDRMAPVPSQTKFIAGYVYTSPDGEEVPLDVDDVITSMLPDPDDAYRGLAPIGALVKTLAQNDAQAAWNASLYRNSAQPGGIIKVGRKLSDPEWDELVERWRMNHQGVQNAGRVAVLEGADADFVPLAYTQKDMQFVETIGLSRQAVFDTYAFPKFGIGDVDDVNRASADASMALMAQTLIVPRLEDFRAALNTQFLPMFGNTWKKYEFNYRNPIPPDAESERNDLKFKTEAFAVLVREGVDPAEAAEVCGLPPMTVKKSEPVTVPVAPGVPNVPTEED